MRAYAEERELGIERNIEPTFRVDSKKRKKRKQIYITRSNLTVFFFRFLAFSPVPIESIVVEIDGKTLNSQATHVQGALFVCPWNPAEFSSGVHSITVKVQVRK